MSEKIHTREWFYVLQDHFGQVAKLIKELGLREYQYDRQLQQIVAR